MEIDDLLSQQFDVSDALEPSGRAALASACQQLDRAPARRSLRPAEAARIDGERLVALRQALTVTRELVTPSHFDLQVLAVLMRLAVEVHGVNGVRATLSMIVKLLDQSWGELARSRELASNQERDKLDRRRGNYLDAVFEQIYFWLARERERAAAELGQAFAPDRAAWLALVEGVDTSLARSSSKVSRWGATREALEACLRVPAAGRAVDEGAGSAAGVAATAAGVATTSGVAPTAGVASTAGVAPAAAGLVATPVSAAPPSASPSVAPGGPSALLEVSARFWELQRRLGAFGALLDSGQFEKARIAARDLSQALERFDVASYFPSLFAGYFELSARYAEALTGPELDSVRSSALAELYRTDLTRFLQLSLERHG